MISFSLLRETFTRVKNFGHVLLKKKDDSKHQSARSVRSPDTGTLFQ